MTLISIIWTKVCEVGLSPTNLFSEKDLPNKTTLTNQIKKADDVTGGVGDLGDNSTSE
ncbi:272_t:CDS:2 [Funneliformis caledonium]|uniref:272_t:CDS:1 n=1 Tax=Funneliformis caledonium TaxID=1117310 RepID=A0A9N9FGT8_9GLOM|nr:272_t:CDS:2 [Funneliformis caledonium]